VAATLRKVLLLPPGLWLRDYSVVFGFLLDVNFCRDIIPPCTLAALLFLLLLR
jgi:hypothetical protein